MGTANHLKVGTLSTTREDIRLRRGILMKREMGQIGNTPTADILKIDILKAGILKTDILKTGIRIAVILKAVSLKIDILKAGFQKADILNTGTLNTGILKADILKVGTQKAGTLKVGILETDILSIGMHLKIGTQPISIPPSIIGILQKDQIDIGLLHIHQREDKIQQTIAALSIIKDTWNAIRMCI